jgi:hypothetical protein
MKEAKARRAREKARKLGQIFFRVLVFGQLNHLALPLTRLSFFIFHFSFWRVKKVKSEWSRGQRLGLIDQEGNVKWSREQRLGLIDQEGNVKRPSVST